MIDPKQISKDFKRFVEIRVSKFYPDYKSALSVQVQQYVKGGIDTVTSQPLYDVLYTNYLECGRLYGAKTIASIQKQLRERAKRTKARMPIGFSDAIRRAILNYLAVDLYNEAEILTDVSKEHIIEVLTKAELEGFGIDEIVKRLTQINAIRARTIARTESVTASNLGGKLAAQESGYSDEMLKEWIGSDDGRERPTHIANNGVKIAFKEYFNVGGFLMDHPGDRRGANGIKPDAKEVVNCRCTCAYTLPL